VVYFGTGNPIQRRAAHLDCSLLLKYYQRNFRFYSNQLCRFLFAQEQGIPKLLALKYVFAMLHCKDLEMYKALAFFIFFENET
jgi:hypothetical protein